MKTPDVRGFEPKGGRNQRFESLVKGLVEKNSLFPEKQLTPDSKLDIISAIENNEVSVYVGNYVSDNTLDAIHCLIAIYDELNKGEPDESFIEETLEKLKGYLSSSEYD